MRRHAAWFVGLFLFVAPVRAAEPQGKLVLDVWDTAYLEGVRTGFFHTTVREVERGDQKLLQTTMEMNLQIRRYNATVTLRMLTGSEETPEGKVTGVSMTQFFEGDKKLLLTGVVEGKQLHVVVKQPNNGKDSDVLADKMIRWDDRVIGLYQQERLFQLRKAAAGDHIKYLSFEPTFNTVVTIEANVKEAEAVDLLRAKKGAPGEVERVTERLLRVEAVPEKITVPGTTIALPTMVSWLDKDLLPVRSEIEISGLGKILLYRTTREIALARGTSMAKLPDIGLNALIPLNQVLSRPHDTKRIVYRIKLAGDEDPATAFAQDGRQVVKNVKGRTFDLEVRAFRPPDATDTTKADAPAEFLESCYFIDSDNPTVRRLAREAVGSETDPWRKAVRIEKWVFRNIQKKNYNVAFATAGQVAENLEGDCRQHAVLAAAMCRAAGVPSRTAVGLVYVLDAKRQPVMGFHMWAEALVGGRWMPIDATLGRGSIGAAHIKIADSSWHDVQSLTPLLPVTRILGKVSIEVVSVEE